MKNTLLIAVTALLLFVSKVQVAAQNWSPVGPDDTKQLVSGTGSYLSSAYIGLVLYVAYWSGTNPNGATVGYLTIKKLASDGSGWEDAGPPNFYQGTASPVGFAYNGTTPYILYAAGISKLNAVNNTWDTVNQDSASISGLQLTRPSAIAFHNNAEYRLNSITNSSFFNVVSLQKLNAAGTSWSNIGAPVDSALSGPYNLTLVFNGNDAYVIDNTAFADGSKANIKKLNASATGWDQFGPSYFTNSATSANYLSLLFYNNTPYVASTAAPTRFISGPPVIQMLNAEGTGWETVGNANDFAGVQADNLYLDFNGDTPYIVYIDNGYYGSTGKAVVKKLNAVGTDFELVGKPDFTNSFTTFTSLQFIDNMPVVIYADGSSSSSFPGVQKLDPNGSDWDTLGGPGFTASGFTLYGSTPYALYSDAVGSGRATVRALSNNIWKVAGNSGFSTGAVTNSILASAQNEIYAAYGDGANNGEATVMKLTSSSAVWQAVGNSDFSAGSINYLSLAFDGSTPYLAYQDAANAGKATVMKLNAAGTGWETVGTAGLSAGVATYTSLAINNAVPYVAYADSVNNNKATVKKLISGVWQYVGNAGFSAGAVSYTSIVFNGNIPYVIYQDQVNGNKTTVMKLNAAGTGWDIVGIAGFSVGATIYQSLTFVGSTPYAGGQDLGVDGSGHATVMKLNAAGSSWETVGKSNFTATPVNSFKLAVNGSSVYALYDGGAAFVKKYEDVNNPEPVLNAFTPDNGRAGDSITITGSNLSGVNAVTIGGVAAASFKAISANSITAKLDTGASGAVIVTTPGGIASLDGFTFNTPPVITSFTPAITGTQTQVIISGSNFSDATAVSFGGIAAKSFTVNSQQQITAVLNTGASGMVSVTTPFGTGNKTGFLFVPKPVITPLSSTTFASGGSVVLKASTGPGYHYQWLEHGGTITGATDSIYKAVETNDYTVIITAGSFSTQADPISVNVIFTLSTDNFKVSAISVTCKGQNDGSIEIAVAQSLNYTATLTDSAGTAKSYSFNQATSLSPLGSGNYNLCITIADQPDFKQCFNLNITEPQDLSVYSTVNKTDNTLTLQLSGSTYYSIRVNSNVFNTSNNSITVPLSNGVNNIVITTDKLCQGTIKQMINNTGNMVPFPNPFTNILYVNLGQENVPAANVEINDLNNGRLIISQKFFNQSGVLQMDMTSLKSGAYSCSVLMGNSKSVFKILKK